MVYIQAQAFVPAALPDEVGCIQSYILVQDLIVLEKAHRKQYHESHEMNTCQLVVTVSDSCAHAHAPESQRVRPANDRYRLHVLDLGPM